MKIIKTLFIFTSFVVCIITVSIYSSLPSFLAQYLNNHEYDDGCFQK